MCNKCNDCNDCNPCNPCKCENRYQGPDILQVGITTGMTYDEVLEILSNYTSDVEFTDGVGIESEGYNPLTGVLTLNFTDGTSYSTGDLRGPQGPAGSNGLNGDPGPNQLLIQNTLIVSKNGNDSTGVRNDWAKPFLTITGANTVAQPGDLIVIYPGTYSESNVVLSDIAYYFYKGAIVSSSFTCISDTVGFPKNIMVYGEGDFIAASGRAIFTNDPDTNVIFNFNYAQGFDGILIGNANNINIKGKHVVGTTQYTISIRGNATGYVDIDYYDGSVSANKGQTILIRNASLDLVERTLVVKGKKLLSNCEFLQGAITTENCNTLSTVIDIDLVEHVTSSDSFTTAAIWHHSGKLKISGTIKSANNFGVILGNLTGDTILQLVDCQIKSRNSAISVPTNTANVYAEIDNTYLGKTSDNAVSAIYVGTTAGVVEMSINNSTISNLSSSNSAHGIELADANSILRLNNVKADVTGASAASVYCPSARTIFIESMLSTNKALDVNVTNGVTGSTVIVDTDIKRNTKTFN